MKKFFLSSIFALALLATAGWGVNKSMNSDAILSDLALANVEALANGEIVEPGGRYGIVTIYETGLEWRCIDGIAYQIVYSDSDCYTDGNLICPGPQMTGEEIGYCE